MIKTDHGWTWVILSFLLCLAPSDSERQVAHQMNFLYGCCVLRWHLFSGPESTIPALTIVGPQSLLLLISEWQRCLVNVYTWEKEWCSFPWTTWCNSWGGVFHRIRKSGCGEGVARPWPGCSENRTAMGLGGRQTGSQISPEGPGACRETTARNYLFLALELQTLADWWAFVIKKNNQTGFLKKQSSF